MASVSGGKGKHVTRRGRALEREMTGRRSCLNERAEWETTMF